MNKKKELRICVVASAGGHLSQVLKLANSWKEYDSFYVTTSEVVREQFGDSVRVYVVGECNRKHLVRVVKVLLRCARIIVTERPDVVVSTGAAVGCIMCFLAKLFAAKAVWIDSITNVHRLSLSGRIVRHMADIFLVQWPELAAQYSNVEYVGTLI